MKKALLGFLVILSSASHAVTSAQLHNLFKAEKKRDSVRFIISQVAESVSPDIAKDLTEFVYEDGVPTYIIGNVYACQLKLKYHEGDLIPIGVRDCIRYR